MRWITPEIEQEIIAIRHDLHRHPELSWEEFRTAGMVSKVLTRLKIAHRTGIAKTGVVADVPGYSSRPVIAIRADMDALPIQEDTDLAFASENQGVMHACGHDGHTSMLLGVAIALANAVEPPPLPIRLIFQPAEEVAAGARVMIDEDVLEDTAMIFGAHIDCSHPVGKLVINEGVVSASRDVFRIEITGRGGHAARPQEAIDAIAIGTEIAQELQSMTKGSITPKNPAVVSLGCFRAGSAPNVISESATLEGTIYTRDEIERTRLKQAIGQIATRIADKYKGTVGISMQDGIPAIINEPDMVRLAREVAVKTLGEEGLADTPAANMGAEDFSCFLEHVSGCYVRIGAWNMGTNMAPAHSGQFDFDEGALAVGAEYLTSLAVAAGKKLREQEK